MSRSTARLGALALLAWAAGPSAARAQVGVALAPVRIWKPSFLLCNSPPPLGWEFCDCLEIGPGHYGWVCMDAWEHGNMGPTGGGGPRATVALMSGGGSWAGMNAIVIDPRVPRLLRGRDANGDGVIADLERRVFSAPPGPLPATARVTGFAIEGLAAPARLCYALSQVGLISARDLDGDGLAVTAALGETRVALGAGTPRSLPGASGAVTMDYRDFLAVAPSRPAMAAAVSIFGWEGNDMCVYQLSDANGDGDFGDPGERGNLFNATAVPDPSGGWRSVRSGWQLNADVAAGSLPSCYDPRTGAAALGALAHSVEPAGAGPCVEACYFASTLPPAALGVSSKNALIYRGVDRNGDGDVNDAGETTLFYEPAGGSTLVFPFERILDIAAADGELFALQSNGPPDAAGGRRPTCWGLRDRNGDGDALDPGEVRLLFIAPNARAVALELLPPHTPFPGAVALPYGWGCSASPGAPPPSLSASAAPRLGAGSSLHLLLTHATARRPAALSIGLSRRRLPNGAALPLDLGSLGLPGCWLLQSAEIAIPGSIDPSGRWAVDFGTLPADPALAGLQLHVQGSVVESVRPGLSLSAGLWLRLDF